MPTYNNSWQTVDDRGLVDRFPVIGGWLVRVETGLDNGFDDKNNRCIIDKFVNITFVPDPNHQWK